MRICIAQINTTPGDFAGNLAKILTGIRKADAGQCDLVVFPELTIPGYLSQDLLYNPDFIDRNLEIYQELIEFSAKCQPHIIVGFVDRNDRVGKPFKNMAGVLHGGEEICVYQKQLLPFYDVFDELRYFEPGSETTIFECQGNKIGVAICEDLWNDKGADDYNYHDNPFERYRKAEVDILVSLNSSPFVHGKCEQRLRHIAPATASGLTVVYVNQRGGQDELVFDGQSFVVTGGRLTYLSSTLFEDTFDVVELGPPDPSLPDLALADSNELESAITHAIGTRAVSLFELIVLGLRDYVVKSGFSQLVLASSGGVDSAVVCKIACAAVGSENVHAIRMPSMYSSGHSRDDAKELHRNLGCWDYEVPIEHESVVEMLNNHYNTHAAPENLVTRINAAGEYASVADENIQARLRDLYIMHFSNAYGAMPLSTGNKTESGCGYYTHFDMNFSYAPIKDLYKFQVVDIARSDPLVPTNIWQKPPSAELAHNQTDEASLLPYAVLDPIVMAYIEDYVTSYERFSNWVTRQHTKISGEIAVLLAWLKRDGSADEYQRIVSLIGRMEYKRRQTCPGTKVSKVAFGIGRRIPIVEKWS